MFPSTPSTTPAPALEAEGLGYTWPGRDQPALRDCGLQVPASGLWMLVGSNGSGKSTLLRLIAGLLPLQRGQLRSRVRSALVFQNPDHQLLLPSCGSELLLAIDASLERDDRERRLERALDQVGLAGLADRPIHALSGGQKQRLAIAAALASEAELLLLDEPTALLDPASQQEVLALIRRLTSRAEQPLTALWITHRLEELASCDGAALMRDGHLGPWQSGTALARRLAG
ncbi:MAG: energy-coupling factor ABC transporter ATP-binding protein [Cyanobium sp. Prado107]|nr:energy-coupling factor ABC transporter ATP-binding protein [Cyanobium sp. Prado107]